VLAQSKPARLRCKQAEESSDDIYIIEKKLQFITLLTAIVHCFTHRKQQKW